MGHIGRFPVRQVKGRQGSPHTGKCFFFTGKVENLFIDPNDCRFQGGKNVCTVHLGKIEAFQKMDGLITCYFPGIGPTHAIGNGKKVWFPDKDTVLIVMTHKTAIGPADCNHACSSFNWLARSCPQAALISLPISFRTVTLI